MSLLLRGFVDTMSTGRFNSLENLAKGPKHRVSLFVRFFDLRLKKKVNVIGHHARGIELILAMFMCMENALQHEVAFGWDELAALGRREGDDIFGPGAFEVR